ncbi:hypothetical protein V7S43_013200 [Phytophthora oleae]|uniref:NAD(P)-binding domain-containing protein n=1 Tax=Phytophthora oleae TaxID=2107226 RepID=A0ABD3F517_9STRA
MGTEANAEAAKKLMNGLVDKVDFIYHLGALELLFRISSGTVEVLSIRPESAW